MKVRARKDLDGIDLERDMVDAIDLDDRHRMAIDLEREVGVARDGDEPEAVPSKRVHVSHNQNDRALKACYSLLALLDRDDGECGGVAAAIAAEPVDQSCIRGPKNITSAIFAKWTDALQGTDGKAPARGAMVWYHCVKDQLHSILGKATAKSHIRERDNR